MAELIPQSQLNAVIGEERARKLYEDGAARWRMPHQNRRIAPNGVDTDSMDYRGVLAAFAAIDTLPKDRDAEGRRLPLNPQLTQEHFRLGLLAVGETGLLPLDDRFVAGYERLTGAIVAEAVEKSAAQ